MFVVVGIVVADMAVVCVAVVDSDFAVVDCSFDGFDVDLTDFQDFLVATKHVKPGSIKLYIQGVRYFRRLIEVPETLSEIEIIPAMWQCKAFRQLLALPILNPELPTTMKIAMSMSHYMNDMLLRCDELEARYCGRLAKMIRLCFAKLLKPFLAKAEGFKKHRAA